jgi:hypothetical protein
LGLLLLLLSSRGPSFEFSLASSLTLPPPFSTSASQGFLPIARFLTRPIVRERSDEG